MEFLPFRAFPSSGAVTSLDVLCLLAVHWHDVAHRARYTRTPWDTTRRTWRSWAGRAARPTRLSRPKPGGRRRPDVPSHGDPATEVGAVCVGTGELPSADRSRPTSARRATRVAVVHRPKPATGRDRPKPGGRSHSSGAARSYLGCPTGVGAAAPVRPKPVGVACPIRAGASWPPGRSRWAGTSRPRPMGRDVPSCPRNRDHAAETAGSWLPDRSRSAAAVRPKPIGVACPTEAGRP